MPREHGKPDSARITGGFVNCPTCGCPNRASDHVCSFCGELLGKGESMGGRIREAVETLKWRYKLKSPQAARGVARRYAGGLATALLALALLGLGGWFLATAVAASAFSEFLIGALFALYGGYALVQVLRRG